jgi:hypothetical protein
MTAATMAIRAKSKQAPTNKKRTNRQDKARLSLGQVKIQTGMHREKYPLLSNREFGKQCCDIKFRGSCESGMLIGSEGEEESVHV